MRDQEIVGLWEAYNQICEQETATGPRLTDTYEKRDQSDSPKSKVVKKLPKMGGIIQKEEVEIAAEYFYEMGLNEDGVDILIEDLGLEGFANFVYNIAEEYYLTEARAGGAKIEPKLSSGKPIQGKPKAASLKSLRKKKAARQEEENKASESKPSGMKASLQRQSAVAAAAKKQPKKPGFLDRVVGAVDAGIKRHNAAMSAAKETGKTIGNVAKKVGGVAREVGKGASGAARLAGHVARKGLNDEYIMEYLIDEGYADTEQAAEAIMVNMSEDWRESIVEEVLDERNRGEEGMSDREVSRRRNLGGNTRSKVSSSSLGDHGPQGAIQKFHSIKSKQRQELHKTARGVRGDTGESGGKGRYEANKDHADGYPSITKRGQGPS
jgi:hypothetical protein